LHSLVTDFTERSGIRATFDAPAAFPPLHPDADLALFRALQEALSNVVRHAQASQVDVLVTVDDQGLVLSIRDDGNGFPIGRNGRIRDTDNRMGLTGMRERIFAIGGDVAIANRSKGAEVRISAPRVDADVTPSATSS
jgi:signal transduction histidine kinase